MYFIGIGGVGMSALALHFHRLGYCVRGSDSQFSSTIAHLQMEGIQVFIGEDEYVYEDIVVYTAAISPKHKQLVQARQDEKRLFSRGQLLGLLAEKFPHVIGISGCHGKTTCTAMLAHVFSCAGKKFTCFIGGEYTTLSNDFNAGSECLILEACEYQRSFLYLVCECAVVLNIDLDHMDCYRSEGALISAFQTFVSRAEHTIMNAEDSRCGQISRTVDFGLLSGDYRAEIIAENEGMYTFQVIRNGVFCTTVCLSVCGKVNVYNALAAFAVADHYAIPPEVIARGLQQFQGVKRRFENIGAFRGSKVICDYAHHPQELYCTLQTARKICKGNIYTVFQPHTYSRTQNLFQEFVRVLFPLKDLIIYRTYAAREAYNDKASAKALASCLPNAIYVDDVVQLQALFERMNLKDGDIVLVLGAGDIYDIVFDFIRR
jgi:UDP-N-acetylmuramate--alanine ligase